MSANELATTGQAIRQAIQQVKEAGKFFDVAPFIAALDAPVPDLEKAEAEWFPLCARKRELEAKFAGFIGQDQAISVEDKDEVTAVLGELEELQEKGNPIGYQLGMATNLILIAMTEALVAMSSMEPTSPEGYKAAAKAGALCANAWKRVKV
jgi:hypothetical protein